MKTLLCTIACTVVCILLSSAFVAAQDSNTLTITAVIRDQAPSYMNHSRYPASWWNYNGWSNYPTSGNCGEANGGRGFDDSDFELPLWMYATNRAVGARGEITDGDRGFLGTVCNRNNLGSCGKLGVDGTPMYKPTGRSTNNTVQSPQSFRHWFHNTEQTRQVEYQFVATKNANSGRLYTFADNAFFPIDGRGWKDQGRQTDNHVYRNFAFCVQLHAVFQYQGGDVFDFTGDDDMFVYIDRKLVLDLGGVHQQHNGTVNLNDLGFLTTGLNYDFDMFYCERHTTASNIRFTTSLELKCPQIDGCGICSDGQSCCNQDYCRSTFDDKSKCFDYRCSLLSNTTCTRTAKPCSPANSCFEASCDARTGECVQREKNCQGSNKCRNYGCNIDSGCTWSPKTCSRQGNSCYDVVCDPEDGGCKDVPKVTCPRSNGCYQYTCINGTGQCDETTPEDRCRPRPCATMSCTNSTGACVYTPIRCTDGDPCTDDSCNDNTGQCEFVKKSCNSTDPCADFTCNSQTGNCDRHNLTCASGGSCQIGLCANTTNTNKCLTARSSCVAGGQCEYIETNCATSNPCQIGHCNTTTGGCYTTPAINGTCLACGSLPCRQSDDPCRPIVCKDDQCVEEPVVCENPNACNTASCANMNGRAVCRASPITCSPDLAADACTPVVCDPLVGCVNGTSTCNDYNLCTDDTCGSENCTSVVPENVCNDDNACTIDSCDSGKENATTRAEACEHVPLECPPSLDVCMEAAPCHPQNGCQYVDKVCQEPSDWCQVSKCDRNAGCVSVARDCTVDDPDCYIPTCDNSTQKCGQRERSNFATITSSKNGGRTCFFVYNKRTVAAITGGAAAGIAIGGAVAIGLIGYGGKKGYDLWSAHQNTMSSGVSENPLYTPSENAGDNPLYGTDV